MTVTIGAKTFDCWSDNDEIGLVDTGANCTLGHSEWMIYAQQQGIDWGVEQIGTAGGSTVGYRFPAILEYHGKKRKCNINALIPRSANGEKKVYLIGMDVLEMFELIINTDKNSPIKFNDKS